MENTAVAAALPQLKRKNYVPPGGAWFYTVPETKQSFEDRMGLAPLVETVQRHYAANKIPAPLDLAARIEAYICSFMPEGTCTERGGARRPRRLDFFSVLSATELLLKRGFLTADKLYVPMTEASKRASICLTCPLNLQHMCTTCNGLRDTFKKLVANRTTPLDSGLGVCEACGCGLSAKVHISLKHLPPMPKDTLEKVPMSCWARPTSGES